MNKDYYSILGLGLGATNDEVRRAYRCFALKNHPDINGSAGATERMQLINEAYLILSNESARAAYDREYRIWLRRKSVRQQKIYYYQRYS